MQMQPGSWASTRPYAHTPCLLNMRDDDGDDTNNGGMEHGHVSRFIQHD